MTSYVKTPRNDTKFNSCVWLHFSTLLEGG